MKLPSEPVCLLADSARLTQVFSNLLINACKYMDPNGRVALEGWTEGGEVLVKVSDTGVGIPPEQLTRIFDMFAQVNKSLERTEGGLGIGLTLVQSLVEMHGGTVEAFSEGLGKGSEFVVRLPVLSDATDCPEEEIPAFASQATRRRRILVVDDNVDAAMSLAIILEFAGHEVHSVHDGLGAVDAAGEFRPEVILLDIGLPGLSGLDVARHIRQEPWGAEVSLVALTGWGQEEDRRNTQEAGFDAHLVKPVEHADLMALLERM